MGGFSRIPFRNKFHPDGKRKKCEIVTPNTRILHRLLSKENVYLSKCCSYRPLDEIFNLIERNVFPKNGKVVMGSFFFVYISDEVKRFLHD